MNAEGSVLRARAVRELHRPLRLEDLAVLTGRPHNPTGTLRAGGRRDGDRAQELEEVDHGDAAIGPTPKRVQITREVINRLGGTPGCLKCRGVLAGDRSYQFVHHTDECRRRMENLMRQDELFSKKLEAAEERQTRRIAEVLERRDREAALRAARQAPREPPEVRGGPVPGPLPADQKERQEESQRMGPVGGGFLIFPR